MPRIKLKNIHILQVINYIYTSWGNKREGTIKAEHEATILKD
jgi:hypothetical protein